MQQLNLSVLALLTLGLLAATPASARPLMAVLDFSEARTRIHTEELAVLADIARGEALRVLGHDYDVITRENLVDLLKSHGKTLEKCRGECETETGRLLGADLVVSGRIVKAFGKYKVNLKVHRTDPPSLLGAEMISADKPQDLEEAVRAGTRRILSNVPGARVAASAPPPTSQTVPKRGRSTGSVTQDVVKSMAGTAGKSDERSATAEASSPATARQAVTGLANQANALRAKAKRLEKDWFELARLAKNENLPEDQRIAAVKLFLTRAPEGSAYHGKATTLLAELAKSPAWYAKKFEFVSVGYAYGTALQGGHGGFVGLATFKWEHFYWQILELVALSLTGTYEEYDSGSGLVSMATVVGYRQQLAPNGRHDLRLGLGLSGLHLFDNAEISTATGKDGWVAEYGFWGRWNQEFQGMGLVPELGWVWHMNASTSLFTKLRVIIPLGDGNDDSSCHGGINEPAGYSCPWFDGPKVAPKSYTPKTSVVFSLGLGW